MRISFLLMDAYSSGGTIRTTYNTASALAARHDVEIVSVYQRRQTARFAHDARVPVRALSVELPAGRGGVVPGLSPWEHRLLRLPSLLIPPSEARHRQFSALTDLRLVSYLRRFDRDVLITTRPGLNLAASRFVRSSVVKVGQEHLFLRSHRPRLQRRLIRAYRRLDTVSTLTERDARDYRDRLGPRTPVVCIPNGVAMPSVRSRGDSSVVVAAGRLRREKGFDRLVPAFARVARDHPGWELRIFGTGEDRDELLRLVEHHKCHDRIALRGHTDHLDEEMAAAAIYVMSSRVEGFPMVLLEAMAVGLPVVSFDCPNGPADLITPGVDGLLVPNDDVGGLASALAELVENPERRRQMGEAARRTAAKYDVTETGRRWEEVLENLVRDKGARRLRRVR